MRYPNAEERAEWRADVKERYRRYGEFQKVNIGPQGNERGSKAFQKRIWLQRKSTAMKKIIAATKEKCESMKWKTWEDNWPMLQTWKRQPFFRPKGAAPTSVKRVKREEWHDTNDMSDDEWHGAEKWLAQKQEDQQEVKKEAPDQHEVKKEASDQHGFNKEVWDHFWDEQEIAAYYEVCRDQTEICVLCTALELCEHCFETWATGHDIAGSACRDDNTWTDHDEIEYLHGYKASEIKYPKWW